MLIPADIKQIVKTECERRQINPHIIEAIIATESSFKNEVARYESHFTYTFKADFFAGIFKITTKTEICLQKFSWGLMQIMGGTARSLGCDEWLPNLCQPKLGIYWGCEYFQKRCMDYLDMPDQVAAYNAGSVRRKSNGEYVNQEYVDKVMGLFNSFNNK